MGEHTISDEFGILPKTGKKPKDGIKAGKKILHGFDYEYGPVPEYADRLKNEGSSTAYNNFKKDYDWLEAHIGKIADFVYREHGIDHINMCAYFIILKDTDHDCVQIHFPYENTALNYHYNGPNFAQYLTSTISSDISPNIHMQKDLVSKYFNELWEAIPDHQLKNITWIVPKFISDYALDVDPHLTVEMEFDLQEIQRDRSGIYSDLFIQERKKLPFVPFQPIFGGEKGETAVIILPKEDLFDVNEFRNGIAKRINIDPSKIKIDRRYDFKIATEDLKYSVGLRTARNIRVKYKNPTEISDGIVTDFVRISQQGLEGAQKCATSDYTKGKNLDSMKKGLVERILKSYENPLFVNVHTSIFGPPEELFYFDDRLRQEMYSKFREYKKKRLGQ